MALLVPRDRQASPPLDFDIHQLTEGAREVSPDDLLIDDPDLLEHLLEQHSLDVVRRRVVERPRLSGQFEQLIDAGLDRTERGQVPLNNGISCCDLTGMALLFLLELVDRDGVGVIRLLSLLLFASHRGQACLLCLDLVLGTGCLRPERLEHGGSELSSLTIRELKSIPMLQNGRLDPIDCHVPLGTSVRVLLAAEAVEVGVLAVGDGDPKTASTATTEDRALERMRPVLRFVACKIAAGQQGSDDLERNLVDECFVPAGVLDPAEGDDSQVVAVVQHFVELLDGDRAFWKAHCPWHGQSAVVQLFGKLSQRVLAERKRLEGPPNM